MDTSNSAASTLVAHRISTVVVSGVAAASIGYFLYRAILNPPLPQPEPGQLLHRSNAVRRRRRSFPEPQHDRRPSVASSTTSQESHGDENVDITTFREFGDGETVADEHTIDDEWWNNPSSAPPQRAGQNIVGLLFRVSEDNARRNAYVHRGCACNACGIVPIRGIRYRCANCADFDLCETCEAQGLHIKTHIFYKVKIPAPPFGPRQMQPVWYPGDPEASLRNLPREAMVRLSKETGFERPELEAFWEQWTFMANTEWREDPDDLKLAMDRKTFERCLVPSGGYTHTAPNLIHDRMFSFYDTNNDDLIGFTEFLHGLSYRKRKNKLRNIFDGYDVDRDGFVNRRDFLRVFRAYYVLYKQMHKDILEGLDDQVMSSTEAHQLVTGRQPLSSLFGREGRVPEADGERHMEGKIFHDNGEVLVSDTKRGVVGENKPDTSDREAILNSLFNQSNAHGYFLRESFSPTPVDPLSPSGHGQSDSRYWRAMLNPPTTVGELPALLAGALREGDAPLVPTENEEPLDAAESGGDEGGSTDAENPARQTENGDNTGPSRPSEARGRYGDHDYDVAPEEPQQRGPAPGEASPEPNNQLRAHHQRSGTYSHMAAHNKRLRKNARRKLLERWKRRQFYLDEEEGATAPEGWTEGDDILAQADGAPGSSKVPQHPAISPRSRSSSKVRFAEDTDDYEIRSNPSTSSRSIPERWGGMDIPDAERDAGKEILYQVTQQAFNELLDILFAAKESLAVEAAETKATRDKNRHLFEWIDLEEEDKKAAGASTSRPDFIVKEFKPQEQSLEELLEASGYTIEESPLENEEAGDANDAVIDAIDDITGGNNERNTAESTRPRRPEKEPAEEVTSSNVSNTEHRDPTMPQFRPNSLQDLAAESSQQSTSCQSEVNGGEGNEEAATSAAAAVDKGKSSTKPKRASSLKSKAASENGKAHAPIKRETLVKWKRLDLAEKEARDRGGWGMLSFKEFEEIYKAEEEQANRLDYLGSWIDFCIP